MLPKSWPALQVQRARLNNAWSARHLPSKLGDIFAALYRHSSWRKGLLQDTYWFALCRAIAGLLDRKYAPHWDR